MINVKRVMNKRDLKKFVSFGNQLYRDNPYYVPDLISDDFKMLSPKHNPAYEFCETAYFIAYDSVKIVGRIGIIINHKSNSKWQQNYARFTHFDFIDDLDVSRKLMDEAVKWAKEKGQLKLHGPLGFTDLDHQGMLVEGFEEMDLFITIYNSPYYVTHMEALGFEKDIDWVECQLRLDEEKAERLEKIANYLEQKSAFRCIEFTRKKDVLPWAKPVFELYNTAYAPLYGTTDLNEKQVKMVIKTFLGFVNPDFIKIVVDQENQLAGFAIAMPSLSNAIKKSKGKLFPFGFLHILKSIKKNSVLDLYLIAVKPELQSTGINGILLNRVLKTARKYGMTHAETGPMLESNLKVQSQWKFFDVRQHRRRRVWIKSI